MKQEVDFSTAIITVHPEAVRRHFGTEIRWSKFNGRQDELIALVRAYGQHSRQVQSGKHPGSFFVLIPAGNDFLPPGGKKFHNSPNARVFLELTDGSEAYVVVAIKAGRRWEQRVDPHIPRTGESKGCMGLPHFVQQLDSYADHFFK